MKNKEESLKKSPVYICKAPCKFVNPNSLHFDQNLSKYKIDQKRRKLKKVQDNVLELDERRQRSLDRSLRNVNQDDRFGLYRVRGENSETSLEDVKQDYYLELDKRRRKSSERRLKDIKHHNRPELDRKRRKSLERKLSDMKQEDRLGLNRKQKKIRRREKRLGDLKQNDRLRIERRRRNSSEVSFGNSNEDNSFSSLTLKESSSKKPHAAGHPRRSKDVEIDAGLNDESKDTDQTDGLKDTGTGGGLRDVERVEKKEEPCGKTYIPVMLEFVANALILLVIVVFISENFLD